jgi:hypothetical protein
MADPVVVNSHCLSFGRKPLDGLSNVPFVDTPGQFESFASIINFPISPDQSFAPVLAISPSPLLWIFILSGQYFESLITEHRSLAAFLCLSFGSTVLVGFEVLEVIVGGSPVDELDFWEVLFGPRIAEDDRLDVPSLPPFIVRTFSTNVGKATSESTDRPG